MNTKSWFRSKWWSVWSPAPIFGVAIVMCIVDSMIANVIGFTLAILAFHWRSAQYWSAESEAKMNTKLVNFREEQNTFLLGFTEQMSDLLKQMTEQYKPLTDAYAEHKEASAPSPAESDKVTE